MVSRMQLCGEEQSATWDAAILSGLSNHILSVPFRSLKQHVADVFLPMRQLGHSGGRKGGGGSEGGVGWGKEEGV